MRLRRRREPVLTGRAWNYTNDRWGHAISLFNVISADRKKVHASGHGPEAVYRLDDNPNNELRLFVLNRMDVGDLIVIKSNREGDTACYRVDQVKYFRDPRDMWSADLSFHERTMEEKDRHHALLNKRHKLSEQYGRIEREPMPVVGDLV